MAAGVRRSLIVVASFALLGLVAAACTGASASEPDSASAPDPTSAPEAKFAEFEGPTFITPSLGDVVSAPVEVEIDPGSVDPTGETIEVDYHGRFHVLVDRDCVENGDSMPIGEEGHFDAGLFETSLTLDLAPGAHELCVQFANAFDVAFYSTDSVTIRVES